tara:strand:+ start:381 stop:734 length:354 start_codon:yes stop_codon:yes gene_type:complete
MKQQIPTPLYPEELQRWLELGSDDIVLIDVREEYELLLAKFPFPFLHYPLSQPSNWMNSVSDELASKEKIVIICHSGIRSLSFGTWLIENDFGDQVFNLEGGIDAWSERIDSTIPRY